MQSTSTTLYLSYLSMLGSTQLSGPLVTGLQWPYSTYLTILALTITGIPTLSTRYWLWTRSYGNIGTLYVQLSDSRPGKNPILYQAYGLQPTVGPTIICSTVLCHLPYHFLCRPMVILRHLPPAWHPTVLVLAWVLLLQVNSNRPVIPFQT